MHPRCTKRTGASTASVRHLEEIEKRIPGFPIVLHGASLVVPEYVETINKYGGALKDAVAFPKNSLERPHGAPYAKLISTAMAVAVAALIRKTFAEKPAEFDPRKYLGPAHDELTKMIIHKTRKFSVLLDRLSEKTAGGRIIGQGQALNNDSPRFFMCTGDEETLILENRRSPISGSYMHPDPKTA